ncbi:MAG: PQQ-binding-like beta-propeller repeat protein [Acidobacteria bacterium]|nr:PQQ-binding-like beta-propeller repeat protein [Acidobacteriota bacterium]MDA1233427.1 PQQ-binding-like beta-propeller repeat protein [Acidobacteriota bacterium]
MVISKFCLALATAAVGLVLVAPSAAASWPQWRGPNNDGVAESSAPTKFSATDNVKWRVPIPGHGNSTPIIVGDRIFLTTAVRTANSQVSRGGGSGGGAGIAEHEFVVMALNKATGEVIWRRTAITTTPHEGHHEQYGSFASNSPVSDGQMLFASFGSRGVYAYDLDGNLKWKKEIAPLRMRLGFGEGTALVLHGNSLILQHDQQANSYVSVLDKRTGEQIWRADRSEESAWAQPLVVEYEGRKQLITSSTRVRTYDLETGELIWEAGGLGGNAIPAVVQVSEDMVIALTGWRNANLLAIKLGGQGDITGNPEFIKWTNQRGNSYTPSPVLHDGILYLLADNGVLSAFDALTGEVHYIQQRLPEFPSFKASPVAAGGNLYTASENGMATVVKLGKQFEVVAANNMGDEMFVSSPVVVDGDLFLRSQDELFCISED